MPILRYIYLRGKGGNSFDAHSNMTSSEKEVETPTSHYSRGDFNLDLTPQEMPIGIEEKKEEKEDEKLNLEPSPLQKKQEAKAARLPLSRSSFPKKTTTALHSSDSRTLSSKSSNITTITQLHASRSKNCSLIWQLPLQ